MTINLKIWLEGGDIDCTNALASTFLNVLFKFGSANELLAAPTLSGNSNYTITGLDTTMEWATTNTATTVCPLSITLLKPPINNMIVSKIALIIKGSINRRCFIRTYIAYPILRRANIIVISNNMKHIIPGKSLKSIC